MQDKKFDLGSNKFITVQDFKGKPLIHIREYYKDKESGDLKPGKKGIALSIESFNKLKESLALVDIEIETFSSAIGSTSTSSEKLPKKANSTKKKTKSKEIIESEDELDGDADFDP